MPYVSITGLKVKSLWHWPRFAWHAVRSMTQARKAEGCLRAEVRTIGGVQHTLSVWVDRKAMRNFMMAGAHREAMRDFRKIAEGSTYGFETEIVPEWPRLGVSGSKMAASINADPAHKQGFLVGELALAMRL